MPDDNIVELDSGNFTLEVMQSEIPVLVDFWAEWCGPCKMLTPVLEELAGEYRGKVKVGKVNIDSNQDLSIKYGIQSIPTLLFFKNGEAQVQQVGLKGKAELKGTLDSLID